MDEGPETYTVDKATRILKLTPGRLRQMLRAGELEGIPPVESGSSPSIHQEFIAAG